MTGWLQTLQHAQAEARQHHAAALAQVQAWAAIPDGGSLFNSIVVFENYPINDDAAAAHGLQLRDLDAREKTNYPLSIVASPGPRLTLAIGYDPQLFDTATVRPDGRAPAGAARPRSPPTPPGPQARYPC